jgi:hypothetical protein
MADEEKLKHHPGWSRVLLPVGLSGPVGSSVRINSASSLMRERIRKQLKEYRAEALQSIGIAVTRTRSQLSSKSQTNSHAWYRAINKDNEAGFKKYMDQSAKFIRHVAPGSSAEYVDELWDGGHKLKQEIMAKTDHVAASGNSMAVQLRNELKAALDGLIERKVEDFEIGFVEGKDMSPTTQNTVNIINSNISHAALQITKSGKDAISKKTALKLQDLVNSEEIKALPENERLGVLDRVSDVIKELQAPTTDTSKVHRGLKKLGGFISSVASTTMTQFVAQAAIAYATANGLKF